MKDNWLTELLSIKWDDVGENLHLGAHDKPLLVPVITVEPQLYDLNSRVCAVLRKLGQIGHWPGIRTVR